MTMAGLITPARVIPSLKARDEQQVVREMARAAARAAPLDPDNVLDAIRARGDLRSCTLGRGVALPEAMMAGLEKPLGVFARLEPAVDFGAEDWEPIDLVLLVLSPAGDEGAHLQALSCAARRLSDLDVRVRLRAAAGADAIHVVLTSDAWRGLNSHGPLPSPTRDVHVDAYPRSP